MTFLVDGSLGGTFPSWTTATRPASPAVGQMGYNTTTGQFDQYTSFGWASISGATTPQVTTYTSSSGTYTTPTGAKYLVVEMVGGGGGGSCIQVNSTYAGAGGGAGGYLMAIVPSPSATYAYAVGAGGSGGSAGTGGNGGGAGAAGRIVITAYF